MRSHELQSTSYGAIKNHLENNGLVKLAHERTRNWPFGCDLLVTEQTVIATDFYVAPKESVNNQSDLDALAKQIMVGFNVKQQDWDLGENMVTSPRPFQNVGYVQSMLCGRRFYVPHILMFEKIATVNFNPEITVKNAEIAERFRVHRRFFQPHPVTFQRNMWLYLYPDQVFVDLMKMGEAYKTSESSVHSDRLDELYELPHWISETMVKLWRTGQNVMGYYTIANH